jgi:hypothetical protein
LMVFFSCFLVCFWAAPGALFSFPVMIWQRREGLSSDSGLVIVFFFSLYAIRVFFGLRGGFLYFLPPKSFVEDSFGFRRIWILRLVRGTLLHRGVGDAREWRG